MGRSANLRLETKGRVSNLPHIVELRFSQAGGCFFVLSRDQRSDWVLNALNSGAARMRLGDSLVEVMVHQATEEEKEAAFDSFRQKYGESVTRKWYPPSGACLRLEPEGPFQKRGASTVEGPAVSTFAQWRQSRRNYYTEVAGAFNSASDEYDFTIRRNYINTWIRKRSIGILLKYARPQDVVLEIGCGTGEEAIEVSRSVKGLVATDVSQGMIDLLAAKVAARKLQATIKPFRTSAAQIAGAAGLLPGGKTHVVYSFNGALNCEPDLDSFVWCLRSLVEPGGYFICSIRNTVCLGEMLSHALLLQFGRATPRKRQPIMVSVGGVDIPSTYYSPSRFKAFFLPHFKLIHTIALPALIPPAYLNDYYVRLRGKIAVIERLETIFSSWFPFNNLGDQTLFVFRNLAG